MRDEPEAAGLVAHLPAGARRSRRAAGRPRRSRRAVARLPPLLGELDHLGRRLASSASEPSPKTSRPRCATTRGARPARHSCMTASASGVLKSSSSAAANASQSPPGRARLAAEGVAEGLDLRRRLLHRLVGEVDRLAPVRGQEEEEHRLAAPLLEDVAQRGDVAERLRHLLAGELEHPVVHPDARELAAARARLRELVLVVREDEVEPAAVDLERAPRNFSAIAEHSMCQPGRPRPQGDSHHVSSPGLFAFQSAKSRGSSLSGFARSCSSTWSGRWPESGAVLGIAADAEVDVAVGRVRVAVADQLLDQRDDLGDRLGRLRLEVGPAEPEQVGVLQVPLASPSPRARRSRPGAAS